MRFDNGKVVDLAESSDVRVTREFRPTSVKIWAFPFRKGFSEGALGSCGVPGAPCEGPVGSLGVPGASLGGSEASLEYPCTPWSLLGRSCGVIGLP